MSLRINEKGFRYYIFDWLLRLISVDNGMVRKARPSFRFFTATAIYLVLDFFLGKLVFIDDRSVTVVAIFNPFKKRLRLSLDEITSMTVRSGYKGVTTIYFETAAKKHEIACSWFWFETNKLIKTLSKAGIAVDTWDV